MTPSTVDDALALLNAYSMITLTSRTVAIHRLVQAVARIPDAADPNRTPEAVSQARGRAARLLLEFCRRTPCSTCPTGHGGGNCSRMP